MHHHLAEAAFAIAAALAVPVAALHLSDGAATPEFTGAETIAVGGSTIDYPLPGEFLTGSQPTSSPLQRAQVAPFHIMKEQVGLADYRRCVDRGACEPVDAANPSEDVPVTGVSFLDAEAYAHWYSKATGVTWRLPTDTELAAAAAERFAAESFSAIADNPANPAVRWIRQYRAEAAAKRQADPHPRPRGSFGSNSNGLADFAGNVWEWTATCYGRTTLRPDGDIDSTTRNCGVHVLEGRHRAYMSNFVREGKSGGCAVGTPPDNLGFRLVRDDRGTSLFSKLSVRLGSLLHGADG